MPVSTAVEPAQQKEAEQARQLNEDQQDSLTSKRRSSVIATLLLFCGGALVWGYGLAMVGFCLIASSLIFLVRYFDANGQLHEVREQSTTKLAPDLSVLQPTPASPEAEEERRGDRDAGRSN